MLEELFAADRRISDLELTEDLRVDTGAGEPRANRSARVRLPEEALEELGGTFEDLLETGIGLATR
jgi:hypothetical protein